MKAMQVVESLYSEHAAGQFRRVFLIAGFKCGQEVALTLGLPVYRGEVEVHFNCFVFALQSKAILNKVLRFQQFE